MISSKHLVTILCLLLIAASGEGRAASSSTDASADSTTAASTADGGTSSHKHHRKHHTTGTTADGTSSTGTATTSTTTDKTSDTTSSSNASASSTPNSKKANGKSATAEMATTPPAATASTTTPTTPAHGSKKKHGSSTANTTPASSTPSATASPTAIPAPGATAAAASAASATTTAAGAATQTTTTAKTGRHRHHKDATPTPIVVAPSTTPLPPPAAPQTTVTLPVTAPLTEVKLPPSSNVPTVMTGLPVARPGTGTTATLPIGMVRNPTPSVLTNFPFTDYSSRRRSQAYPWKTRIVTTVFWIGEDASAVSNATNHASAWDMNWEHNNGGSDAQYDLNGYASAQHASMLNPFYVALPFNDLAYPEEANRWLPGNWARPPRRDGKPVSACQHRWVEIKNGAGRVCFAQWEDVGPLVTDNVEYVFGPERPSARAGLDVSPAVAKYLGIDSTAYTSWRFVDDEDVQPGMWLRYDEQALLFRALKEQMRGGGSNRALQELSEPVPDDSSEDANQKKAGAARG